MNRCDGSWNFVEDPLSRICIPYKIEEVNLKVFNVIKRTNESKKLSKHISYECRCEFDGREGNARQKWNNKCQYE